MIRRARVLTPKGWIEGAEERGVLAFRGIPFAQSTAGEARFRAPRPVRAWSGTLDASCFGRAAPQPGTRSGPLARWSAVPPAGAGEDCLNLNVWTPAADHRRRAVLIWVHGGGFSHGSGSFHLYAGDRLARRGDVVVVTFNYRLGVFGGLDLRGLGGGASADTNFALRDQIAALEWVQSNIESFGGDPDNVTLFGQSAGAMSVGTLMASPRGADLFRRGILQSGAGDNVLSVEQARRIAGLLLEKLNLDAGQGDVVRALRKLNWATLLRAQLELRAEHGLRLGMLAWQPVIDGDLVPGLPRARFEAGEAMKVPLLIGTNRDEWKMFTATDKRRRTLDEGTLRKYLTQTFLGSGEPDSTDVSADIAGARTEEALSLYGTGRDGAACSPSEIWNRIQTDRVFHYPAVELADAHTGRGAPTWFYRFDWKPPLAPNRVGACHALELAFVFGTLRTRWLRPLFGMSSKSVTLSDRMQAAWLSFARTGDPGADGDVAWPAYECGQGRTRVFGGHESTDRTIDPALKEFWKGSPEVRDRVLRGRF